MRLTVYFDGSCGPVNPGGIAAYGYVIKDDDYNTIHSGAGRVGEGEHCTNNVAEFEAIYQAMVWIDQNHPDAHVTFCGDSSMVIAQMRGEAKARKGEYIPYYKKTFEFAQPYIRRKIWEFRWIQRAFNSEADALAQYYRY